MEDHEQLQQILEERTGIDTIDHLGQYHSWLSKHGISPETEYGWATPESFDEENINAYVEEVIVHVNENHRNRQ
jgi:hypothetical protein